MLKLENLTKYYYSSTNVTCALRKINLTFNTGEFVAITGESGSGKTTLLNVLSGLDTYEDGEMYYYDKKTSFFDEEDWEKYRKEEIAFIFQNYNLIDSYTVLENVMVTYIIDGYSYKEAKIKSKEKLKLVGLEKDAHKKAIKLSGGQKQRLAIARTLAKETNIIVADEPTGNLDVENGNQVLSILKELSKDKLVIVVTHNQAQIEPFATRKIRLHDGEISSDEIIEEVKPKEVVKKEERKYNKVKQIADFSFLNIKSQPKKSFLLIILVLFATISSFVFLANFKMNLDDNKTKEIDTKYFPNLDDTKLLVKKIDGTNITDEDLLRAKVKNVVSVEKYDHITDVNYYRLGDYQLKYDGEYSDKDGSFIDSTGKYLVNNDKFMRSANDLSIDMLAAGILPLGNFEMVVYSEDLSIIGNVEKVLFRYENTFGESGWYEYDVKIVGILKEPTIYGYFSEDLCHVMDITQYKLNITLRYEDPKHWGQESLSFYKAFIDPTLTDKDVIFDEGRKTSLMGKQVDNQLYFNTDKSWNYCEIELNKHTIVSDLGIGLSSDFFNQLYNSVKEYNQFVVFISDYAFTEDVRRDLAELGFDSISCFKASVTGYDNSKVIVRYINLFVSILALLVINLVTVLISFAILKVKKNDFVIFKMIGLSNKEAKIINFVEVFLYGFICSLILVISMLILKQFVTVPIIVEAFKHIRFYDYIIISIVVFVSMFYLGKMFSKYLKEKVKITVLKEE